MWALGTHTPRAAVFAQPTLIIRWVTTTIALVSVAVGTTDGTSGWMAIGSVVLVVNTLARTVWPINRGRGRVGELVAEVTMIALITVATGAFESPFSFALIPPIAVAAFNWGAATSIAATLLSGIAVGGPMILGPDRVAATDRLVMQWTTQLLLVAIVGSYARQVLRDSDEWQREAKSTVTRLADANQLLVTLHEVAQELPASLDLDDALDSVFEHVRSLVPVNYGGIALRDDAGDDWRFAAHLGAADPVPAADARLGAIRRQLETCALTMSGDEFLYPDMSDGRYVALRSRDQLIGVLAIEHNTPNLYDRHHDDALVLVAESAALAIDNARLFDRLRHLGAAEERARIARDLHDRMGQSLAYMGFELDRIIRAADGTLVRDDLGRLRTYLRDATGEVRETLYDLRSDTDEYQSARTVIAEFTSRIEARSALRVTIDIDDGIELARVRERELCRITKEALINAERHSGGTHATVTWRASSDEIVAEIHDDGRGLPATSTVEQDDSYGIVGMRERAAAIGGQLTITPSPTGGTAVQITVPIELTSDTRRVPA